MDSPIEIKVNSSAIEKIILSSIEQSIPDAHGFSSDLQMLTQEEVARHLNVNIQTLTMLREVGIIKSIKTGRCYMFSQAAILRFQHDYEGHDVSNRVKAIEAFNTVKEKAVAATTTSN